MSTATAQRIELPEEQLERLFSSLDRHEREHLALSLLDIIRKDVVDLEEIKQLLADWSMTAQVRKHPHFTEQVNAYRELVRTGELFDGLDLDPEFARGLKDNLL